jgi:hypothetical protein
MQPQQARTVMDGMQDGNKTAETTETAVAAFRVQRTD